VQTHVKVLGVLHLVFGGLGVLAAVTVMLVLGGVAGLVGASGDPDAMSAIPFIGLAGSFVVMFVMVLSVPSVVIGIGLLQFRPWAKVAGIVLSVFHLAGFPFGTIIGIYGLWVLFSKDTEPLFAGAPLSVPPVPSSNHQRGLP
jgi:hypothetical protein